MIGATRLFRSGKRYRGFASVEGIYTPITFTAYPADNKQVRLRYLFPVRLYEKLHRGSMLYSLIEDDDYLIAELRVTSPEPKTKSLLVSLDFVTKDRRKLPRIKVSGILDIKASILVGDRVFEGKVIDLSMASLSVETGVPVQSGTCDIQLVYRSKRIELKGRIIRSSQGQTVMEITEGNGELTNFLSKVYSDLFLRVQRSS